MKKVMMTLSVFFSILTFVNAQQNVDAKSGTENDPLFSGDMVKIEKDGNLVTYSGNASVKTDIIEIKKAEKVEYNFITKKIIVYVFEDFAIKGSISIPETNVNPTKMEFTIGETVAYIK